MTFLHQVTPIVRAFSGLRQEDGHKFEARLGYIHINCKTLSQMTSTSFSEDEWDIYNSCLKCLHFNFHSSVLDLRPISLIPCCPRFEGYRVSVRFYSGTTHILLCWLQSQYPFRPRLEDDTIGFPSHN